MEPTVRNGRDRDPERRLGPHTQRKIGPRALAYPDKIGYSMSRKVRCPRALRCSVGSQIQIQRRVIQWYSMHRQLLCVSLHSRKLRPIWGGGWQGEPNLHSRQIHPTWKQTPWASAPLARAGRDCGEPARAESAATPKGTRSRSEILT